jgi:hypothetical protein
LADSKNVNSGEMIAIGYQTSSISPNQFNFVRIIYSSIPPYAIVTKSNFQSSSPFAILNFEIRGLYIQSENILFAALIIVPIPNYKFYIATIDISTN